MWKIYDVPVGRSFLRDAWMFAFIHNNVDKPTIAGQWKITFPLDI